MAREVLSEVSFELSPEGEGAGFGRSIAGGRLSKCKDPEVRMDQMRWGESPSHALSWSRSPGREEDSPRLQRWAWWDHARVSAACPKLSLVRVLSSLSKVEASELLEGL